MVYSDINRRFTDVVSGYIGRGYVFNTATQNGSQGEITKVDLTNGEELIRISLKREVFREAIEEAKMEQIFFGEAVVLTVGKYIGIQDVHQYLGDSRRETIWRHELQTITEEYFCEIGNRDDGGKWYGTKGEFREAESKRQDRYRMNKSGDFIKNGRRCTTKNARKTALAHIRRLKGYRQTKISDIWQVWILADQHTGRETHCVVLRSGKDVPF